MRRDGVVVLDRILPSTVIDDLRVSVLTRHPEFADKGCLTDHQDNGEGRFIAPVAISRTVWDSGLLTSPALHALARATLGADWVFDAFGMLMAFPGCADQRLHRDGETLFPETALGAILPPFALTVLVPLVDVSEGEGQTAFVPGSHRYPPGAMDGEELATPLSRGSILVWDFEILHRGIGNRGPAPRPALYLTLSRPFWTDMANFGGKARARLVVDPDVVPLLDRRFARAGLSGRWAHEGLGKALPPIANA